MDKQLAKNLGSGSRKVVLDTLKKIRQEGQAAILPEVFALMAREKDEEILQACASLLNDLKSEEAPALLAEAISNPAYRHIHRLLVAACWQNGLNYGPYAEVFLKVALEGDLETSIEAFTVLEEAVGELELADREKMARDLKPAILEASDDKQALLHELYRIIDQFQAPNQFSLDPDPD